jgi:hypothetical protein
MMTTILILTMILVGALAWLGASLVCLVVAVVFKALWFGAKFLLTLGWGALLLGAGVILLLLKLTGLFAFAFLVFVTLAVAYGVAALLGGAERGPASAPHAGQAWAGHGGTHDELRRSIARFERRLENLETILSAR